MAHHHSKPFPAGSILNWGALLLCHLAIPALAVPIDDKYCQLNPKWHTIIIFLLTNYASHAATVPPSPGVNIRRDIEWAVIAFFLPYACIPNSCLMILHYVFHRGDDVGRAIGGQALLVVARKQGWKLQPGEQVYFKHRGPLQCIGSDSVTYSVSSAGQYPVDLNNIRVHGDICLPPGYELVRPHCSILEYIRRHELECSCNIKISRPPSVATTCVSIAQVIFACITIYRARGIQINYYGYAAYGLSVFPYAFMSLVNLTAACVVGSYPYAYVLRTSILEEAKRRGGRFHGAIGVFKSPRPVSGPHFAQLSIDSQIVTLGAERGDRVGSGGAAACDTSDHDEDTAALLPGNGRYADNLNINVHSTVDGPAMIPTSDHRAFATLLLIGLAPIVVITPYALIWGLTNFKAQHSTLTQRVAIMTWLSASQFSGLVLALYGVKSKMRDRFASCHPTSSSFPLFIRLTLVLSALAAVLGFVAVFQMLLMDGAVLTCVLPIQSG